MASNDTPGDVPRDGVSQATAFDDRDYAIFLMDPDGVLSLASHARVTAELERRNKGEAPV